MPLNVELRRVKARDLKPQAVNARFMAKDQFDALVANIREDGVLTSTPLLYQPGGVGDVEIVSGHHRTLAVLEALGEDAEYDAMVVLDAQSRDQIIARQLSHNSISGVDDPATLKRLWEEIEDVDWKKYAALDDRTLKLLAEVDLLAARVVPAEAAAVVVRALQKVRVDAGDKDMPLARALELMAADYLGNA
jgi:hypothetical protein